MEVSVTKQYIRGSQMKACGPNLALKPFMFALGQFQNSKKHIGKWCLFGLRAPCFELSLAIHDPSGNIIESPCNTISYKVKRLRLRIGIDTEHMIIYRIIPTPSLITNLSYLCLSHLTI